MKQTVDINPPSPIVAIFNNSRLYGANYDGENLPIYPRKWPTGWLTRRLREVRQQESSDDANQT